MESCHVEKKACSTSMYIYSDMKQGIKIKIKIYETVKQISNNKQTKMQ